VATRSSTLITPGRITWTEIKYSHANRNSSFAESCSIARENRNSASCFHSNSSTGRHPEYRAISRRWPVRV
jgi:hypothetical protein